MRGNWINHAKKYAREEELKELQRQFTNFVSNDFASLQKEVTKLGTNISWLEKLAIGLLITIIGAAIAIIIA